MTPPHAAPLKKIVRTEVQYWNLSLGVPTEYMAGSGPEADERWNQITAPPGQGKTDYCILPRISC